MKNQSNIKKALFFTLFSITFSFSAYVYADPLGVPNPENIIYPDGNPPSKAEIELGKMLFFDPKLSETGKVSCSTCHESSMGFSNGVALGYNTHGDKKNTMNVPHFYNIAWAPSLLWDGRFKQIEDEQEFLEKEVGSSSEHLQSIPYYRKAFKAVYESEPTTGLAIKAIASFMRSIITNNSAFDKYLKGNKQAMSPAAIRGLELFKGKAGCIQCHDGSNLTDYRFQNIGLNNKDVGRYAVEEVESLKGAFKVPGLRNVLLTAPYMHDGSIGSLEEVIRFFNRGGNKGVKNQSHMIQPLELKEREIFDLAAFLGSLTDPVALDHPIIPPEKYRD